jgi:formylglycine-generating enzyme required for sulfatase activity
MVGNLPEWTGDTSAPYPGNSLLKRPPSWYTKKMVRGGWPTTYGGGINATTSTRLALGPNRSPVGFRCVAGPSPAPLAEAVVDYQPVVPTIPAPEKVDVREMVYVPAGEFIMGTPEEWLREDPERHRTEAPQHVVYLDAFYIDKYEVTNAEYAAFLNTLGQNTMACYGYDCASVRREEDIDTSRGSVRLVEYPGTETPYHVAEGYERYPVIRVSWYGAQAYCAWLDKRLPTEAEWEKAARGTDGRRYPWGDAWDERSLADAEVWDLPIEIGSDPLNVSPYGTVDMLGNAGEWVLDWFDPRYYALSPYRNPRGPSEPPPDVLQQRSLRSPGGGDSVQWGLSARGAAMPWGAEGFRCVYSTTPVPVDVEP